MSVNSYLISTNQGVVLIDSGCDKKARLIIDALQKIDLTENGNITIINTHGHRDHTAGNRRLSEFIKVDIAIHLLETEKLHPDIKPHLHLKEGDIIDLGKYVLRVVHTPGHSPGHICLYEEYNDLLFSGDMIVEGTRTGTVYIGPPEGSFIDYMSSLIKLQKMKIDLILPGHGRVIESPQRKIREIIIHNTKREEEILDALEEGQKKVYELSKIIYGDEVPDGLARGAVIGRIEKLLHEGLVEATLHEGETCYMLKD